MLSPVWPSIARLPARWTEFRNRVRADHQGESGPSRARQLLRAARHGRARGTLNRRSARIGPPQPAPEETPMLTIEKTADYVQNWIAAFEAKDLDRVLAFY